jgi:hypothetical protein
MRGSHLVDQDHVEMPLDDRNGGFRDGAQAGIVALCGISLMQGQRACVAEPMRKHWSFDRGTRAACGGL